MAAPSLALRASGAVLLMIGFYALALAIAGALFAIPVAEWTYAHRIDFRIAVFCVVGGFAILKAIVPRADHFEAPGPVLQPAAEPKLFSALEDVARKTGQAMPSEVFLVPQVNAWVAQRGGILGIGSKRVMGLGLPLLQTVSIDELRAILAHEFGHYHGGDTALGPWIYRTRAAIGRTLAELAEHSSMLMKPFEWYGALFLRITHAISRRQEYAADALAARAIGAAPLASGLRAIHGSGAAFEHYWATEVGPLLDRGYRPPIAAGFTHFLATPVMAPLVAEVIEAELKQSKADPYDTHPPLAERLAALGGAPAKEDNGPRAITLLTDVATLESQLLAELMKSHTRKELKSIDWREAGTHVWPGIWREQLKQLGNRLDGIKVRDVPALVQNLPAAAMQLGIVPRIDLANENAGNAVVHVMGSALAVALLDRGWEVSALPGELVVLSKDGESVTPFVHVGQLASKELSDTEWRAKYEKPGMLDIDFGSVSGGITS